MREKIQFRRRWIEIADSTQFGARQDKSVFFEAIWIKMISKGTDNHLRRRARRSTSEKNINGGSLLDLIKSCDISTPSFIISYHKNKIKCYFTGLRLANDNFVECYKFIRHQHAFKFIKALTSEFSDEVGRKMVK